jgi:hypothetical protein
MLCRVGPRSKFNANEFHIVSEIGFPITHDTPFRKIPVEAWQTFVWTDLMTSRVLVAADVVEIDLLTTSRDKEHPSA